MIFSNDICLVVEEMGISLADSLIFVIDILFVGLGESYNYLILPEGLTEVTDYLFLCDVVLSNFITLGRYCG